MVKMNIHRAMSYLKTLDKRIVNVLNVSSINLVGCKMKIKEREDNTNLSVSDFNTLAKSQDVKATKLIDNYLKVKNAIALSNSTTKVKIGDKEMTIVELLNYKKCVEEYKQLQLRAYRSQRDDALVKVERKNAKLENEITDLRLSDSKDGASNFEKYDLMRRNESWELVDPLNIQDKIQALEEEILILKSQIDDVLSTSNAITYIEVDIDEDSIM